MTVFVLLLTLCFPNVNAAFTGVDLHVHAFMDEGLGPLFHGKFTDAELKATTWRDRFSSQINADSLEHSGLGLVLFTAYAHPILSHGVKDSIRRQLKDARQFVATHPEWVIATTPDEAVAARAQGKRIIILALETAAGTLDSDEDLKEFIDRGGIRIVTLLHLTDDELGGVAFLAGFRALADPIAYFRSVFGSFSAEGVLLNRNGLTAKGEILAKKLIAHKVWIDLAHSSDESQKRLIPILNDGGKPLLYTHTVLRSAYGAERAISSRQVEELAKSGGIIGLMPSEEMLEGTVLEGCQGGIHKLARQFRELTSRIAQSHIDLGSDFNGGIPHLKPIDDEACKTHTDFDAKGLVHIGQSQATWDALSKLVPLQPEVDRVGVFLETWKRLWGS